MNNNFILAPSILSADFSDLASALKTCEKGGAEWVHVDIMDNHFVPNLTIGPVVLRSLRPRTELILDVHLMVTDPESLVPAFIKAGADGLTIHLESLADPLPVLKSIKEAGLTTGISIKPGTDIAELRPYYNFIDLILVMSVEPGFGGQSFIEGSLKRIKTINDDLIAMNKRDKILIEVDGGINLNNANQVLEAGADILVAGSAVFGAEDPVIAIKNFKSIG